MKFPRILLNSCGRWVSEQTKGIEDKASESFESAQRMHLIAKERGRKTGIEPINRNVNRILNVIRKFSAS